MIIRSDVWIKILKSHIFQSNLARQKSIFKRIGHFNFLWICVIKNRILAKTNKIYFWLLTFVGRLIKLTRK